ASGRPACGERPQDWCRDVRTAARCGVLEQCWPGDPALTKGVPCHLCQVVVSVVGKILQDNRTESDPKVVCGTIKLCQSRQRPDGALTFEAAATPRVHTEDFTWSATPFMASVEEPEQLCGACARLVAALQAQLDMGAGDLAARL
ncbi:SAP protein, partial [Crypturellus soui]|nr:SAP protein [Crypturellus soui]